ncbi:MAG: hypothetical protein EPO64_01720 [Nitrospirae bacterium]|nr:MAG: hypothetical protein EPO64_01720 [Nitrospirota bacterium]
MPTLVKACPKCSKLMWIKEEHIKPLDDNTIGMTCPHCHQSVRFSLVTRGDNAVGPKMGH